MRLGADPDDLERLAALHDTCAAHLGRVRTRLRAAERGAWQGRSGARWWGVLDELLVPWIVTAGNACAAAARHLRSQAREQRRASLPEPPRATVDLDRTVPGRWVGRTGAATAEVALVLVPGVGTDLADLPRLGADATRVWEVTTSHIATAHLGAEDAGRAPEERVAVISWLGYDAPVNVLAGIDRRPALQGARQLLRDVARLRADGARRVVVAGHSYGAVVAAHAAALGMDVDELVLLGPPGLGVGSRSELQLPPGADLWVASAPADPISYVARASFIHGPDARAHGLALPTSQQGHGVYLHDPVLLDALAGLALGDQTVVAPARSVVQPGTVSAIHP